MAYAVNTKVPIDRSQGEIRKILTKYSATSFAFGDDGKNAVIMFEMADRRIRFNLPMPPAPSKDSYKAEIQRHEQKCRSRWRSLLLAIKAKLECVESGIATLEEEFLAHIVLPNGKTVGDAMIPQIELSYTKGKMPPLLGYSG